VVMHLQRTTSAEPLAADAVQSFTTNPLTGGLYSAAVLYPAPCSTASAQLPRKHLAQGLLQVAMCSLHIAEPMLLSDPCTRRGRMQDTGSCLLQLP